MLLEEICKRSILGQPKKKPRKDQKRQEKLLHVLQKHFHYVGICDTPAVLLCAASGRGIPAQVDDMAQMIGRKIPCCLHVRRDMPVSYTHLRAHETRHDLVCRLLLEKKKIEKKKKNIKNKKKKQNIITYMVHTNKCAVGTMI